MIKIDVHQHLLSPALVEGLARRRAFPFVRSENGVTVLYIAGERPYVIDAAAEAPEQRAALVERDRVDSALLCLSSALGIESLPREQSRGLIDAYLDGALGLGAPFGAWGPLPLEPPDASDVDDAIGRGCVGISMPAGAIAGIEELTRLSQVLARLEEHDAPLLIHPGGAGAFDTAGPSLRAPLWWPAMTSYLAQMHAAWMAFVSGGRAAHPRLRVVFAALAGLAPLHAERLHSRGGPSPCVEDPLTFYETSSYGPRAVRALGAVVGDQQLLYGSDRPIVEPAELDMPGALDWDIIATGTVRALSRGPQGGSPR
jgi:hypothetical protein